MRLLASSLCGVVAVSLAMGSAKVAFARERGPRVEVFCPAPPIPVALDQQQVLVYELHLTNFDSVPLTLTRVEIFANQPGGTPLATLSDHALAAAMVKVGSKMMHPEPHPDAASNDTRILDPGGRNVLFLWIAFPSHQPMPTSVRHRMTFSAAGSNSDAILEDYPVSISRETVPILSPPFRSGIWLAGDGPSNSSNHRRSIFAIDGHIYSPEVFAIDWIKVGPNGDSHHDGTASNENWWGFGEPVLAVADGEITEVVDGIADNVPRQLPPVTLDNIAGNHVILQIAPDRYVTYAHLRNGSIKVKLHDRVRRGDVLALLGNSGNTTGAHLHLQVSNRNSAVESRGIPFVLPSFTYLGPGADYEIDKHVTVPWKNSIPPGDAVIEFNAKSK